MNALAANFQVFLCKILILSALRCTADLSRMYPPLHPMSARIGSRSPHDPAQIGWAVMEGWKNSRITGVFGMIEYCSFCVMMVLLRLRCWIALNSTVNISLRCIFLWWRNESEAWVRAFANSKGFVAANGNKTHWSQTPQNLNLNCHFSFRMDY